MQPPANSNTITIMTYNILVGGKDGRMPAIEAVIRECDPDVVGVQEANDIAACYALADRLGMECVTGYAAGGYHVGLLSRWPIRSWANYSRPWFQKTLIEAVIDIPGEPVPWHVFVGHGTAEFAQAYKAERRRARETRTFIECMALARAQEHPHVLLGDFNALAPGERLNVAELIARVTELDDLRKQVGPIHGQPHLKFIIPPPLHPLIPLIRRIPEVPWLAEVVTRAANLLIPRWSAATLLRAGYVDCLRSGSSGYAPRDIPPTCPLPRPSGRIDYIWADPAVAAPRLTGSVVVTGDPACPVDQASDHRPVLATFARVAPSQPSRTPDIVRIAEQIAQTAADSSLSGTSA
ncbi:MAG TPA: endonuclease/exonuclease/phosphatase family protein [Ktedonobacterales bacterium]|nr:endonuclease/exonuclease/phosphatase family protein [Ktedonobacterales bacterium]